MRSLFATLAILISIIGLFFIVRGCRHPGKYQKILEEKPATAVRVTQIYTEATHRVVVGIAIVSLAILIAFIGTLISTDEIENLLSRFTAIFKKNPIDTENTETSEREENEVESDC